MPACALRSQCASFCVQPFPVAPSWPATTPAMIGTVCPCWPCPFCILETRHTATQEQVRSCMQVWRLEHEARGRDSWKFRIRCEAYDWLEEVFRTGMHPSDVAPRADVAAGPSSATTAPTAAFSATAPPAATSSAGSAQLGQPSSPPGAGVGWAEQEHGAEEEEGPSSWPSQTDADAEFPQFFFDSSGRNKSRRKWTRYDKESEKALRLAWASGSGSAMIAVPDEDCSDFWHYRIVLTPGSMTQTSEDTGFVRKVRVRTADETWVH